MLMCGMPSSTCLREEMIRILKWTDGAGKHRRSSLYIAANRVLLSFVVSRLKFESRRNMNRDIATHASNQTSIFQFGGLFLFHIL